MSSHVSRVLTAPHASIRGPVSLFLPKESLSFHGQRLRGPLFTHSPIILKNGLENNMNGENECKQMLYIFNIETYDGFRKDTSLLSSVEVSPLLHTADQLQLFAQGQTSLVLALHGTATAPRISVLIFRI